MRRSEGEKNAIITSALDCIIVADSEGRIREFNPAAEKTFGWTKDEVTGRELADTIVPESMREGHRRGMERYLAHGGGNVIGRRIEIKALRRSGEEFPCELAITPINDGHQTFFTAYLRDISARKKAEREVIAAREAAEQANAVKSEFLAHISHEIRTPMNAIVGYSNLALESVDGEDQRQYAEGIADAAKSLLTLVNDVLDLSRLEAGRMSVLEERINLHRLVEQIADTTRILTKDKDIEVKLNSEVAPSARYLGDPDRIRQVLLNLVGNAAKFTERGAIVINIRSAPQGVDAEMFEMSVTDTGIGIREDAKPRIFEPFEQDGSRGRARMPGTGLGLAISRSLAQLMGGDIRFHSTQGHGATFTFSLPLKCAPTDKRDVRRVDRKFADVPGAFKILVAEDTPASRIIMTRLLERRGFTVVVAEDGEDAVRIAGLERPAAIFLDIQMPKMDGFEAARQIRKLPGPVSTVPIIALTAQAFSSDREHCRAAGMDDFLAKPVLPDQLEEVLARTFNMAAPTVDSTSHCENSALGSHLAAGTSLEVFSEPLLRTMIEDIGADTTARILEKSAANADSLMQKLVGSLDAADGRGVRSAAHALVGLLGQIGLNAGAAIAKEIELDAAHASAESISRMQSAITEGMGRARACMADQPEPPDASIVA
jgi:PAS domain S-box-containing protein